MSDEVQPLANGDELMKVLDGIKHSGLGKVWFAGRGIAPGKWKICHAKLVYCTAV
ncbi:hypothetical protein SPAB_05425 [Salmonella enterica subsp. enterica serovar Paratyphi B str. SPB7]|uniref:Uncharacterized protein n=1 Tax=Salmonella paratyphi B (strain ATCC BAA-1250 / SPB7) TaxID=1016998 RepID=A0A6C6Z9C7_SALPB|nr:hypothetical protein SPAB_05425 [Salmonella enterica subsp. enterica serovar Paratyphi B str. SPB7]OSJ51735.1 DNA polymerase V subunit UmuC [Salmonella enterica subsp. enterica serovar Newport str. SHSN003]